MGSQVQVLKGGQPIRRISENWNPSLLSPIFRRRELRIFHLHIRGILVVVATNDSIKEVTLLVITN